MDNIISQLDNLAELTNEQVSELQTSIISEFDSIDQDAPTPASVDAMTQLADAHDTVRGEVQRREVEAEELSARVAEASARVHGTEDVADPEMETPEEEVAPEEETPEEEPVMASAETAEVEAELAVEEVAPATEPAEEVTEEVTDELAVEEVAPEAEAPAAVEAELAVETAVEPEVSTELASESVEESTVVDAPAEAEASAKVDSAAEAAVVEEILDESQTQEEAQTVTAAAEGVFDAPADRRPVVQATVAPVAITAGADVPGYAAGSILENLDGVAQAMTKRLHTLRNVSGGDGEQVTVATVTTQYPDSRMLTSHAEDSSRKIDAVAGPVAIAASGGFLAPLEASYDIFGFGTNVRPVRDSLVRFQADRGGIRFVTPPVLGSYAGAVGIWTLANDVAAAAGTPVKNTLTVGGATEQTENLYAVTLQLQFGNLLTRAYPELVSRHNELALIQHARLAELTLLARINAKSTAVTTASLIGFARDFLVNIRRAAAAYRSRNRIDPKTQLRAIIPTWVYDAMSADLALAMPGDQTLGVTDATIESYLALSNVSLTASLDQNSFGAQTVGPLLEFPDTFTWFLFSEGSFVFLDGGTLDLGIIRDSTLVGTNDYKMFTETFEGLAFVGIESLAITSSISVNGVAAALRDTTGGVVAAAIEY